MARILVVVLLCTLSWGCALPRAVNLSLRAKEMPQIEGHTSAKTNVCASFIPDLYAMGFTITLTSPESPEATFAWYKSQLEQRGWDLEKNSILAWSPPKPVAAGFYWDYCIAKRTVYWTFGNSKIPIGHESLKFTMDSQRQFEAQQPGCNVELVVETDYFTELAHHRIQHINARTPRRGRNSLLSTILDFLAFRWVPGARNLSLAFKTAVPSATRRSNLILFSRRLATTREPLLHILSGHRSCIGT